MNSWARINFCWAGSVILLSTHPPEEERVGLGVSLQQTCPMHPLAWAPSGTTAPPVSGALSFAVIPEDDASSSALRPSAQPRELSSGRLNSGLQRHQTLIPGTVNVALFEKRFFVSISYSHPLSMAFSGYSVLMG